VPVRPGLHDAGLRTVDPAAPDCGVHRGAGALAVWSGVDRALARVVGLDGGVSRVNNSAGQRTWPLPAVRPTDHGKTGTGEALVCQAEKGSGDVLGEVEMAEGDDVGGPVFETVTITPELEWAWRTRSERRRRFKSLEQAFTAYGLRSLRAQEVVREWAAEFVVTRAYRRMFFIHPPFAPEDPRDLDAVLAWPGAAVEAWMPPTGGYLAIGGDFPMAAAEVVDGERIAAKVYKTRIVVLPLTLVGEVIEGRTIWFPGERQHPRAPAQRKLGAVCPTCEMVLPATGVCDNCS